jgi:geranylgeranyl diphosphate synthase type II
VVAEVAAALELLHTAFVVHDDVIDADTVRRGRPNVSGTFAGQARRAGLPAAREAVDAVAHLPVAPRLHDWVATVMAEARSAA